jgi:hypothetical protein
MGMNGDGQTLVDGRGRTDGTKWMDVDEHQPEVDGRQKKL